MKILHTSDWHLGRNLYGRQRYHEFDAFLNWLLETLTSQSVDVLLVAGDIFDTTTPSNRAQSLYYRFLCQVANTGCRHVIIIGGNHDSPSFLNAPRELLSILNIHIVGSGSDALTDQVIVINDSADGATSTRPLIVCAIPYLRDRDIRTVSPGESIADKTTKLIHGVKEHYAQVVALAESHRQSLQAAGHGPIPIVATGHLFAAGGKTVDGDGVRELYIGSLAHMGTDVFPAVIDYLALGHLHVPQTVGGINHYRYSGSPIPMGFGEASQTKKVLLVEFDETSPTITDMPVPCFQVLHRLTGTLTEIETEIERLKSESSNAWLEIDYTGADVVGDLREQVIEMVSGSQLEIRRVRNRQIFDRVMNAATIEETLDDMDVHDVFQRCLEAYDVPQENRDELTMAYGEILESLEE